jgi:hypothetical protein
MISEIRRRMYSVVVARKVGVLCKSCGKGIEIDDDYLPGIRGAEIAASLYKLSAKPVSSIRPWQKTLTCENPNCRETHAYGTGDLRLYDD